MRRAREKLTCHTRTDVPTERSIDGYSCHQRTGYEYETNENMGTTKVSISNSQNHTEEMALAQSVFQKRGPDSQEYDGAGQENLETMQIESIKAEARDQR